MTTKNSTKHKWGLAFSNIYWGSSEKEFVRQLHAVYDLLERIHKQTTTDTDLRLIEELANLNESHRLLRQKAEQDKVLRSQQRATVLSKLSLDEQIALGLKKGKLS